jgi:hypothetical protein
MSAIESTLKARGAEYGDYKEQAAFCVALKEAFRRHKAWQSLAPWQQDAIEMSMMKYSRIMTGNPNNYDSWHDIAGYNELVANQLK